MDKEDPELSKEVRNSITVIITGAVVAWLSLTVVKYIAYMVMK